MIQIHEVLGSLDDEIANIFDPERIKPDRVIEEISKINGIINPTSIRSALFAAWPNLQMQATNGIKFNTFCDELADEYVRA